MTSKKKPNYFRWLLTWISNIDQEYSINDYTNLLELLLHISFQWDNDYPMDANRAADGANLREIYMEEEDLPFEDGYFDELPSCSVLEVMIALADRIEMDYLKDPDLGDRTSVWFWLMLCNLGLDNYINSRFNEKEVENIVTLFLNRQYCTDGNGSLFVTKRHFDMRKMDIQEAMNVWIGDFLLNL